MRYYLMSGVSLLCGLGWAAAQIPARSNTLNEVVVTAQKRATNVQKTPIAITVLSGASLQKENKTRLDEIMASVPGVTVEEGPGGFFVNVRGVTNQMGGTADYPTAMYNDGVYTEVEIENRTAYFDLNRVEVLRGPQGTLYGGNALGGAVNIISNDPQLGKFGGAVQVSVGNYALISTQATLNVPITDQIALRGVVASEDRHGYLSDGQDDSHYKAGRLKALYQPFEALKILLAGQYVRVGGEGGGTVDAPAQGSVADAPDPWFTTSPVTPQTISTMTQYRADINYDAGFAAVNLQPAVTDVRQYQLAAPFGPLLATYFHHHRETFEARATSEAGAPFKWTAGVYYLHYNTPFSGILPNGPEIINNVYNRVTSKAVFGEITYPIGDRLRITAGGRYTNQDQQELSAPAGSSATGSYSASSPTWKFGAEYDVAPASLAYLNISKGFRAGGLLSGVPIGSFVPEYLVAYEAGSKNRFFDNSLQVNGDFFYYDYTNYQMSTINADQQTETYNANGVQEYGAEAEITWRATPADRITFSPAYLHGRFGADQAALYQPNGNRVDIAGQPLDHAPAWTLNGSYAHDFDLASGAVITGEADLRYTSKTSEEFDAACGPNCIQPAYHATNLSLSYQSPAARWSISAYVHNLENYAAINSAAYGQGPVVSYNMSAPRTFGVTASLKFGN